MIVTKAMRRWVRFCRLFFWTLTYKRQEWRAEQRFLDNYFEGKRKTGVEHITIKATNGSVVKNVYVNHGHPHYSLEALFLIEQAKMWGRNKMPRA